MTQVLKDSIAGYSSNLAIFSRPIQNYGCKKSHCVNYLPINDFSNQQVLMFQISGSTQHYLDLSKTTLNLKCKIVRKDGSNIDSWEEELRKRKIRHRLAEAGVDRRGGADLASSVRNNDGDGGQLDTADADEESDDENIATKKPKTDQSGQPSGNSDGSNNQKKQIQKSMVGVVCNLLGSMIQRIDVSLNNTMVTESDVPYAYQSYIKTHFYSPTELKSGTLQSQLYYPDSGEGAFDANWLLTSNTGLYNRSLLFDGSNEVELSGRLACDVFQINKLLMNGISMQLVIYPSSDEFCLMSNDDPADYKLVITSAYLSVFNVQVSNEIIAAHSEIIQTEPAIYPFLKTQVKKIEIPKGIYQHTINDPFMGKIPQEILIGLVSGKASIGNIRKNPFAFETRGLSRIQVTNDGSDLLFSPVQTKYKNGLIKGLYLDGFKSLCGITGVDNENPISRMNYPLGNAVYRFVSESQESELGDDTLPPRRMGNLRINLSFDKMLNQSMTVIVFGRFGGALKIDKNRSVFEI